MRESHWPTTWLYHARIRAGVNVVQVRSLATAQAGDLVLVTVQRPAVTRPGEPEAREPESPAGEPEA